MITRPRETLALIPNMMYVGREMNKTQARTSGLQETAVKFLIVFRMMRMIGGQRDKLSCWLDTESPLTFSLGPLIKS